MSFPVDRNSWMKKKEKKGLFSRRSGANKLIIQPFSEVRMPYLPEDLLLNCLARVPRMYYPTLSLVSKRFRSLLASRELYETRRLLGSTESCLYVCLARSFTECECQWEWENWFTLSHGQIPKPPSSRCFTSFRPCKNRTTRNLMAPVPNRNFGPPPFGWIATAVGCNVYMICGSLMRQPSSRVFFMDCRSHTWHEAPSMRVARKWPRVCAVDGKLYVVECFKDCDPSDYMEFFDPKTQIWDSVPSPGPEVWEHLPFAELRYNYNGIQCYGNQGNLYLCGSTENNKNVVYKTRENKWQVAPLALYRGFPYACCLIDDVAFDYSDTARRLKWYSKERSSWIFVEGLGKLPKNHGLHVCNYAGNIAIFWRKKVRTFRRKKVRTNTQSWCRMIMIERRNQLEVYGKVKWCHVVHTFPGTCFFGPFALATV